LLSFALLGHYLEPLGRAMPVAVGKLIVRTASATLPDRTKFSA
jgi:hypothetical protein